MELSCIQVVASFGLLLEGMHSFFYIVTNTIIVITRLIFFLKLVLLLFLFFCSFDIFLNFLIKGPT